MREAYLIEQDHQQDCTDRFLALLTDNEIEYSWCNTNSEHYLAINKNAHQYYINLYNSYPPYILKSSNEDLINLINNGEYIVDYAEYDEVTKVSVDENLIYAFGMPISEVVDMYLNDGLFQLSTIEDISSIKDLFSLISTDDIHKFFKLGLYIRIHTVKKSLGLSS